MSNFLPSIKILSKNPEAQNLNAELSEFLVNASTVLVDKQQQLRLAWCCLVAGGHILIEDLPGMGKTTMVKLIAKLFDLPWKRIQCTSDMLPADITGGNVFDDSTRTFVFHKGPLFTNLVMADELNRASPKSQSAFLQAMEESTVTVDGVTYPLVQPFVVIATQNSLDSAGTNPLPESQLDRFMMSISLGLPDRAGERQLLMDPPKSQTLDSLKPIFSIERLREMQNHVARVHVGERVADYILDLAEWLRARSHGFSPRTALAITACARAWAFGANRDFVMPADIQAVATSVLSHRLTTSNQAGIKNTRALIEMAIKSVEVPE